MLLRQRQLTVEVDGRVHMRHPSPLPLDDPVDTRRSHPLDPFDPVATEGVERPGVGWAIAECECGRVPVAAEVFGSDAVEEFRVTADCLFRPPLDGRSLCTLVHGFAASLLVRGTAIWVQ